MAEPLTTAAAAAAEAAAEMDAAEAAVGGVPDEIYNWAADQVYRLAKEQGAHPEGFWENAQAFAAAVDWSERWIQGLLALHALLWITVLATRRNMTVQGSIFFLSCGLVAVSERLNTLLRETYWSRFARQNYFDERGVFATVMFTGPLLLLTLLQLFFLLFGAADMLVKVKRAQLREKAQQAKKKQ